MSVKEETKMITELTEAQIATFPHYREKWIRIGTSTKECNVPEAKKYIALAYEAAELPPPEFFIGPVNDPIQGAIACNVLKDFLEREVEFDSPEALNEMVMAELDNPKYAKELDISNQLSGNQEYWFSYADFFLNETEVTGIEKIRPLLELSEHIGWWTALQNVAILQHPPLEIHFDEENRTHNTEGPAIKFRGDNSKANVYIVHGIRVDKKIVDRDYTVEDIDKEMNAEIRRIMIDLYGAERYIMDSGITPVHSDEFGDLYQKEVPDDETIMIVKVVNSTQEPDGTFKDYWIRVDPKAYGGVKTARAAIASTWRNKDGSFIFATPEDYDCEVET